MKNLILRSTISGAVILASLLFANAAFGAITAVTRTGATQTNCVPTNGGTLFDGAPAYCDRDDPVYTYTNFSPPLPDLISELTSDYIVVAVEDRFLTDYGLEVTVDYPGYMLLFIEDGLDAGNMPWLDAEGYGHSNMDVTLAKHGAFADVTMNVWFLQVTTDDIQNGPLSMGPQAEPGTGSIYGVAYLTEDADVGVSITDSPDPVLAGSGDGNFTLTVTAENAADASNNAQNVEIDISAVGLNDGVLVDSQAPVGTTFANGTWSIPDLCEDCSMDLVLTYTVGHQQTSGTDVITWTAEITAAEIFDPNPGNDVATEMTSVTDAASQSVGFDTSIDFLDDADTAVAVTITCNAGLPLSQTFDISDVAGVNFAMTNLPFTTPGTECEIAVDGVDSGYTVTASANGGAVADSCVFVAGTAGTGESLFDTSGANTCEFYAAGDQAIYTVGVEWDLMDPNVEEKSYSVDITVNCSANIQTVNGIPVSPSTQYMGTLDDGESVDLGVNTTSGPASCSAVQDAQQSGVETEASADCTNATLPAGGSAECMFYNTVFFEGIPMLSQYGMAILALLVLSVGFVGFRRFV